MTLPEATAQKPITKNEFLRLRFLAGLMDIALIFAFFLALGLPLAIIDEVFTLQMDFFNDEVEAGASFAKEYIHYLWISVVFFGFFVWLEGSKIQASFGKRHFGLKVISQTGGQVPYWRLGMRYLLFFEIETIIVLLLLALHPLVTLETPIPDWVDWAWLLFIALIFLAAAFSKNLQGLHDKAVSCYVIHKSRPVIGQEELWGLLPVGSGEAEETQNETKSAQSLPDWAYHPAVFRVRRFLAGLLDATLALIIAMIGVTLGVEVLEYFPDLQSQLIPSHIALNLEPEVQIELLHEILLVNFCVATLSWIYFVLAETRFPLLTLGKRMASLKVVNLAGEKPSFLASFFRYALFAGFFLVMIFFSGFDLSDSWLEKVMITFFVFFCMNSFMLLIMNKGFHDVFSRTRVVELQPAGPREVEA